MNDYNHNWSFLMDDFGNPLSDIEDWMLYPYPAWVTDNIKNGEYVKVD